MRNFAILLAFVILTSGCKKTKEEKITRKWIAVSVESPQLTQLLANQRVFIDTVGKSTDASANMELYGLANIDSFRQILKLQMDSFATAQNETIKNTWLDFQKDGTVASAFGSTPDTVCWYFDDEGALILDEMKKKGTGEKIKMEVVQLEDTILQLRFNENNFSSTATFRPE